MRSVMLAVILVTLSCPSWSQTGMIYTTVPTGCQVRSQRGAASGPIYDGRGFFMGYYQPAAPVIAVPSKVMTVPSPMPSNVPNNFDVPMNNGYASYGYGYGYYGYGYGYSNYSPTITNPLGTSPGSIHGAGIPYSPTLPHLNTNVPIQGQAGACYHR